MTYSLDNFEGTFRARRHTNTTNPGGQPTRLVLAGSGGQFLSTCMEQWQRPLLSLLKDNDRGRVDDFAVADWLAALNHRTYLAMERRFGLNNTVGPRSIVIWRRGPDAPRGGGGGGVQFYTGKRRDTETPGVPSIVRGLDIMAIGDAMLPVFRDATRPFLDNPPATGRHPLPLDHDEIDRRLAALPDQPDERLR